MHQAGKSRRFHCIKAMHTFSLINPNNDHYTTEYALPFGGTGRSGQGSYHGKKSFEAFTHERSVMIKNLSMDGLTASRYPPYNAKKASLIRRVTMTSSFGLWIRKHRTSLKVVALMIVLFILNRRR